jgi:uncharacterized protein YfaT (DUF1175 family)
MNQQIKPVSTIICCKEIEDDKSLFLMRKEALVNAEVVSIGDRVSSVSPGDIVFFSRKRAVVVKDLMYVEESDIELVKKTANGAS